MKQKPLKIITVVVAVVVGVIVFSGNKKESQPATTQAVNNINEAVASNYNDSLRAVAARADATEKQIAALIAKNEALDKQNKKLLQTMERKESSTSNQQNRELTQQLSSLQKEVSSLKLQKTQAVDLKGAYPIGGEQTDVSISKPISYVVDIDEQQSHYLPTKTESSYWEKLEQRRRQHQASTASLPQRNDTKKSKGIPYYTLPAGSDLGGATLLSALIGEVPNDNKFAQPLFPFSAIVSRGSLMAANGVPLPPDIKGMKVGGYAIGVGSFLDNISCTRAYVTSALFVFQDGHFETVGKESMKSAADLVDNQAIGYLTNVYGNPCIRGSYHTNAPRVLAVMTGAAGLGGLGSGLTNSQTSYSVSGGGIASAPTGSTAKIMLGSAASEGFKETNIWLKERIKGSFDMVFVPASMPYKVGNQIHFKPTRLTLHLTKTIEINKDTQGRRLGYGRTQTYINDYSLQ